MKDLKILENKIITRLDEIKNKEHKTTNELDEYVELQGRLRELHRIMIWLEREMNK